MNREEKTETKKINEACTEQRIAKKQNRESIQTKWIRKLFH